MTAPQIVALGVLLAVVAALIWGKLRSDVVALAGAATLLGTRTIRPIEVQGAFASPAIIALASLFVIAYAMELSGLLGLMIRGADSALLATGRKGLVDRDRRGRRGLGLSQQHSDRGPRRSSRA